MEPTVAPQEPKPPYPARFCEECGTKFLPKMVTQKFHSPTCQKKRNNRALDGGYKLYPLAMEWRITRKKAALAALTREVDRYADVEREVQRKRRKVMESYKTSHTE